MGGAGILLTIGMAFSGVSWNPINGKMGGFAGLITIGVTGFHSLRADGYAFVLKPLYVYLAVLLVGSIHISFFGANPLVKKLDANTKNNHGNFSDKICLGLLVCAGAAAFYPDHLFMDLGPLKAQFAATSPDLAFMVKFVACLLFMWAMILSGVKWNPINGKMAGLGGFICAGTTGYGTWKADGGVFVPRVFYVYATLIFLSALHIFAFPSNPVPPKSQDSQVRK